MLDDLLIFAEDFAATTASENDCTDYLDMGGGVTYDAFGTALAPDIGFNSGLYFNVVCNTTFASTSLTSQTVTFRLKSCATTNGTYQEDLEFIKAASACTEGARFSTGLPNGTLRYVKATIQPSTTGTAAGFSAWLGPMGESSK